MRSITIPPIKSPAIHPPRQPLVLPPQLDPSCVLCLLPLEDDHWHDYSGNGNHGTVTGASKTAKGRRGFGWSFDGLDDWVNCGTDSSLDLASEFSFVAWAQLGSKAADGNVISRGTGTTIHSIRYDAGEDYWYCYSRDTVSGKYAVYTQSHCVLGEWVHLVGVFGGDKLQLYVNGVLGDFAPNYGTPLDRNAFNICVGCRNNDARYFNGLIDEGRIVTHLLSASEILALYEQGRP